MLWILFSHPKNVGEKFFNVDIIPVDAGVLSMVSHCSSMQTWFAC